MISRIFLASGAVVAAATETGDLQTVKSVLLILFLVIGAVWLLVDIRRNLIATYGATPPPTPAPVSTPASAPAAAPQIAVSGERPSPAVLAVIAAAVHCTLGSASHIVAISSHDDESKSWAAEGRRAIYATRKVR